MLGSSKEQEDRFIELAMNNSKLLKDIKIIRFYPWWQEPIRAPLHWLRWKLKLREKRWEFLEAHEEPWYAELVRSALFQVERFEDKVLKLLQTKQ